MAPPPALTLSAYSDVIALSSSDGGGGASTGVSAGWGGATGRVPGGILKRPGVERTSGTPLLAPSEQRDVDAAAVADVAAAFKSSWGYLAVSGQVSARLLTALAAAYAECLASQTTTGIAFGAALGALHVMGSGTPEGRAVSATSDASARAHADGLALATALLRYVQKVRAAETLSSAETDAINTRNVRANDQINVANAAAFAASAAPSPSQVFGSASFVRTARAPTPVPPPAPAATPVSGAPSTPLRLQTVRAVVAGGAAAWAAAGTASDSSSGGGGCADGLGRAVSGEGTFVVRKHAKPHAVRFAVWDFTAHNAAPAAIALTAVAPPFSISSPSATSNAAVALATGSALDATESGCVAFALADAAEAAEALRTALLSTACASPDELVCTPLLAPSTLRSAERHGGVLLPHMRGGLQGAASSVPALPLGLVAAVIAALRAIATAPSAAAVSEGARAAARALSRADGPTARIIDSSSAVFEGHLTRAATVGMFWSDTRAASRLHARELPALRSATLPLPLADRLGAALSAALRYALKRALNPHVYDGDDRATPALAQSRAACGGIGRGSGGIAGAFISFEKELAFNSDDLAALVHHALRSLHSAREVSDDIIKTALRDLSLMSTDDAVRPHDESLGAAVARIVETAPLPTIASAADYAHAHAFLRALFSHSATMEAIAGDGDAWRTLRMLARLARAHPCELTVHLLPLAAPAELCASLQANADCVDALGAATTKTLHQHSLALSRARARAAAAAPREVDDEVTASGAGAIGLSSGGVSGGEDGMDDAPVPENRPRKRRHRASRIGSGARGSFENSRCLFDSSDDAPSLDSVADEVAPARLDSALGGISIDGSVTPSSCGADSSVDPQRDDAAFAFALDASTIFSPPNSSAEAAARLRTLFSAEDVLLPGSSLRYPTLVMFRTSDDARTLFNSGESFAGSDVAASWSRIAASGGDATLTRSPLNACSSGGSVPPGPLLPTQHMVASAEALATARSFETAPIISLKPAAAVADQSTCVACGELIATEQAPAPLPIMSFRGLFSGGGASAPSPSRSFTAFGSPSRKSTASFPAAVFANLTASGESPSRRGHGAAPPPAHISCTFCGRPCHTQCAGTSATSTSFRCVECWSRAQ